MRGEENEMADDAEVRVARTRASEEAIRLWVGGDCTAELSTTFEVKGAQGTSEPRMGEMKERMLRGDRYTV